MVKAGKHVHHMWLPEVLNFIYSLNQFIFQLTYYKNYEIYN